MNRNNGIEKNINNNNIYNICLNYIVMNKYILFIYDK